MKVVILALMLSLAIAPASHAAPTTNPALAELMDQVNSTLVAADKVYASDLAHARALLHARMDRAKRIMFDPPLQGPQIDYDLKELLSNTPAPEAGVHHVETPILPAMQATPRVLLGPHDAQAADVSYRADLELAHRRWLTATTAIRQSAPRILNEELSRARRTGDDALAGKLKKLEDRLDTANSGVPTTWYREKLVPDASGAIPKRTLPVAMAIHDVRMHDPVIGRQFTGNLTIHMLVAPYEVRPDVLSPDYTLLIYDGDKIVYCDGGAWNGAWDVGSDLDYDWDTHSSSLVGAHGAPFLFARSGTYTMRLILGNSGGWDDVLDVYEQQFTVPAAAQ